MSLQMEKPQQNNRTFHFIFQLSEQDNALWLLHGRTESTLAQVQNTSNSLQHLLSPVVCRSKTHPPI
jgi:hypothetical protein